MHKSHDEAHHHAAEAADRVTAAAFRVLENLALPLGPSSGAPVGRAPEQANGVPDTFGVSVTMAHGCLGAVRVISTNTSSNPLPAPKRWRSASIEPLATSRP